MSRTKGTREPADRQPSLSLTFWPYTSHTVVTIDAGWRDGTGAHRSRLARWHLRLSRTDLAGHKTDDVLCSLVNSLVHRLESGPDPADHVKPVGSGVPLGTVGGTVTTEHLAGVQTDSPPLPGL